MNELKEPLPVSQKRFSKYAWDVIGVILITLSLIGFLAFIGLTSGAWISPILQFGRKVFGWGILFLIFLIAFLGYFSLRIRSSHPYTLRLGQILSIEGALFVCMALFSILDGNEVAKAQAGVDKGGIIGWGLAQLLMNLIGQSLSLVFLISLLVLLLLIGFGGYHAVVLWLDEKTTLVLQPKKVFSPKNPVEKEVVKEVKRETKVKIPERDVRLPPLELLTGEIDTPPDRQSILNTGILIEKSLAEFGIPARVSGYRMGPTVTQFAVEPGFIEKEMADGSIQRQKIRVAQISTLARDLTLALSVERLRIEAPVPGHSYVGIEVPNAQSTVVRLRSILESGKFNRIEAPLSIGLGRDVSGQPVIADLSRMPHLLIAGTTGSGKSVCIIALMTCLVMNNTPEDLRLIMIDPKMVELIRFNGIPHLLGKVETDLERILASLRWTMAEMDHRYRLLEQVKTRDIDSYNQKMERKKQPKLPRIVVVIDELADLMMSAADQTEHSLVRLAQMARATGIHLVVATQRPSTDVITGLIKANFPARISFTVASSIDSRVILDTNGAETLLGRGDMLFLNPESGTPLRSQGVYITDHELEQVINFWRSNSPGIEGAPSPWEELLNTEEGENDSLIEKAITIIKGEHRASASLLQRRLRIGYPRAARLIDELEELGMVGPSMGGGREREVLVEGDEDASDDPRESPSEE
jgi:DNA segregation ATPase FtsK/SpoIIIE, S-DNA-T family